jgi:P-type conjugative transfer ATPase TrbB
MQHAESNTRLLEQLSSAMGHHVEELLNNDDVVEIMLNPDSKLWADSHSRGRYYTGININPKMGEQVISIIARSLNIVCNDKNPIISGELPGNGSRFQGMLPPVVENPAFTIRKKALLVYTLEQYVANKIISVTQYHTIVEAIKNKKNILVVGGTGSGKTTLLNAILNQIAKAGDRLIIIEDTQELQCTAEDKVFMRSKDFVVSMNDLLKSTMRFRPDRIVVGEVRGGEALTLLKAWNTGHPGGCASCHASSAYQGLTRIQDLAQEAITGQVSRELIAEAINMVIYIERMALGRQLKEIIEVYGHDGQKYQHKMVI